MSADATLSRLLELAEANKRETEELRTKVESMTGGLTPEQLGDSNMAKTIDLYERKLTPWRKLWAVVAIIGAVCSLVFGAGVTYQQVKGGLATKDDIAEHKKVALDPVIKDVETIKTDLEPVKSGVKALVDTQNREREIKQIKSQLERHDKEFQEAMQEYTADKAAGIRSGPRPRKTEVHLKLEADLKALEDSL